VDNIQYYKTYLQLYSLSRQGPVLDSEYEREAAAPVDWDNALPSL
jgi:hypothetical protein